MYDLIDRYHPDHFYFDAAVPFNDGIATEVEVNGRRFRTYRSSAQTDPKDLPLKPAYSRQVRGRNNVHYIP